MFVTQTASSEMKDKFINPRHATSPTRQSPSRDVALLMKPHTSCEGSLMRSKGQNPAQMVQVGPGAWPQDTATSLLSLFWRDLSPKRALVAHVSFTLF